MPATDRFGYAITDPSVVECTCGAVAPVETVDREGIVVGFEHVAGCVTLASLTENDQLDHPDDVPWPTFRRPRGGGRGTTENDPRGYDL